MARKVESDEERERRVILVGKYVADTKSSTRDTADYFSRTYFPISNATVSDYCHRFMKLNREEVDTLTDVIDVNTVKSLDDEETRMRVEINVELFSCGLTIAEIVEKTDTSFWTVYRDINRRAKALDPVKYDADIKPRLLANSQANLDRKK